MPPLNVNDTLQLAVRHHQAGRLTDAEALYRQILTAQPNHVDALHLLGVLAGQMGHTDAGIDLIRRAIGVRPEFPDAYANLGRLLADHGRLEEAVTTYSRVVQLRPTDAVAYNTLGIALRMNGQTDQAIQAFSTAVQINPKFVEAYNGLASALKSLGQMDAAIAAYSKVTSLTPSNAQAFRNLGGVLKDNRPIGEAIAAFSRAAELAPNDATMIYDLGVALKDGGKLDDAITAWSKAIQLDPTHAESHANLGSAFVETSRWDEAMAACRKAIELKPALGSAHFGLGVAMNALGQLDEAIACYARALETTPDDIEAHSNLVFLLRFRPGQNPEEAFREYARWNELHAKPLSNAIPHHANDPDPNRRLRIAYVSPDLRQHSVSYFIQPPLANHNPAAVEVFCYADLPRPDAITERLKALAHHWRDITGVPDEEVAQLIRTDQIDVLVDLAGHTERNRLLVFARKPAPVQVTYLGYTDTTGLSAMDYRLTDSHADPPGTTERYHSEELVRLPETFACYRPPMDAPPVAPLPALANGYITFSCFTALTKLNQGLLECWADILRRVPLSHIIIGANRLRYPTRLEWMLGILTRCGINLERVSLLDDQSWPDYLAIHQKVDLMLDTFPVNGHTVTCHSLWMGVPPVTLAGSAYSQRLGCSVLNNLGLPELVANSVEQYVNIAADWANNLPRLSELRQGLRARMLASPLTDGARFTQNLESAYRQMWQRWCRKPK